MNNIILTGLMGSGKTTLGVAAAKSLGLIFLDLDDMIECGAGISITGLFERYGEERFRLLETKACYDAAKKHGQIIATGGGVVLSEENIEVLKSNGTVVFIDRPVDIILRDLDVQNRPLLKSGPEKLHAIYEDRIGRYRATADVILENCGTEEEALSRLLDIIRAIYLKQPKFAVIGDPIAHSLSPEIHLPVLRRYCEKPEYERVQVKRGELVRWIRTVRDEGYDGFNLTMPHKTDIIPFLEQLDGDAALYGSVNTVLYRGGKLYGYSTDAEGFLTALRAAGTEVAESKILLLGAGGAAKAIALKAAQSGAQSITILARREEQAEMLKAYILDRLPNACVTAGKMDSAATSRFSGRSDILINATPIGMEGVEAAWEDLSFLGALPKTAVVCDLIYKPQTTELLRKAEEQGLKTMNGLTMLIHQAILADELFLGKSLDRSRMAELVKRNLS